MFIPDFFYNGLRHIFSVWLQSWQYRSVLGQFVTIPAVTASLLGYSAADFSSSAL
jgi:hypothetical protein